MFRTTPLGLLLLLGSLLLISCNGETGPEQSEDDPRIMPLDVGNRWVGRLTHYSSGTAITSTQEIRIVSSREPDESAWKEEGAEDIWLDAEGLPYFYIDRILFAGIRGSGDPPFCKAVALYPGELSERFAEEQFPFIVPDPDAPNGNRVDTADLSQVVLAVDTAITVPAGTFDCYAYGERIHSPDNLMLATETTRYYAPGVGPVYREERDPDGELLATWELVEYEIR